jgi:TP901 family phage tail tape measure protein
MARASFDTTEIIKAMPNALNLAIAGGVGFAEGTKIMISTMKQFDIQAEESMRIADTLAHTTANYKTNLTDLGTALRFVGGEARTMGISFEQTAMAIGVLSDRGISASRAGTTLRRVLFSLNKSSKRSDDILKSVGLTMKDIATTQTGDLITSIDKLRKSGMNMNQILDFFQIRGTAGAAAFMEMTDAMVWSEAAMGDISGTAEGMARIMQQNVIAQVKILWSEIVALANTLMGTGLSSIAQYISGLAGIVSAITDTIKWFKGIISFVEKLIVKFMDLIGITKKVGSAISKLKYAIPGLGQLYAIRDFGKSRMEKKRKTETKQEELRGLEVSGEDVQERWSKLKEKMTAMGLQDLEAGQLTAEFRGREDFKEVVKEFEELKKVAGMDIQPEMAKFKPKTSPAPTDWPEGGGGAAEKRAAAERKKQFQLFARSIQRENKLLESGFSLMKDRNKVELERFKNSIAHLDSETQGLLLIEKQHAMAMQTFDAERDMVQAKIAKQELLIAKAKELGQIEGEDKAKNAIEILQHRLKEIELSERHTEELKKGALFQWDMAKAAKEYNNELEKMQKAHDFKKEMADLEFAITEQQMIQAGMSDDAITQAEFNHKKSMLDMEKQHKQAIIERKREELATVGATSDKGIEIQKQIVDLERQNEILSKQGELLAAQELTFQMEDQLTMAQDFADAWTGAFQGILSQIQAGKMDIVQTLDDLGNKLINDAMKPMFDDINAMLKETFMKMGKGMGMAVQMGLGVAMMALSGFLNKQKAETEALADETAAGIVESERVRGVVAGDSNIAIGKLSENLGMALRPTNEILRNIDANTAKMAGGSPVTGGNGTMSDNPQTQGGFATESIAGARV